MRASPPVVKFDCTVDQAIEQLSVQNTDFLAVNATGDRFQGVLTVGGLMRIYLKFQTQTEKSALIYYREFFEPLQLVGETEPFPEVVKKLVTSVGHRVFVINNQGVVIGFLTAKDILPILSGGAVGGKQKALEGGEKIVNDPLKSNLYLYESFFSNSPFLMHSANQSGVIQMANEILHRVLGYEFGELIGKTIFDIYPKENHKKAEEGLRKILDRGYHNVTQGQMVKKDGTQIEVELVSKALMDQNDHPIGTVTISRPVDLKVLLKSLPS